MSNKNKLCPIKSLLFILCIYYIILFQFNEVHNLNTPEKLSVIDSYNIYTICSMYEVPDVYNIYVSIEKKAYYFIIMLCKFATRINECFLIFIS